MRRQYVEIADGAPKEFIVRHVEFCVYLRLGV
jgi:hypothetical protein